MIHGTHAESQSVSQWGYGQACPAEDLGCNLILPPNLWPWTSHLTPPGFHVCIHQMEKIFLLPIHRVLVEKERLPTPVLWPGEFHGLYSPWGRRESDMTEQLLLHLSWWDVMVCMKGKCRCQSVIIKFIFLSVMTFSYRNVVFQWQCYLGNKTKLPPC